MELRISFAMWLWLVGALAASCGGDSVSHDGDGDGVEDDGNATGGRATGGSANGGSGASGGGLSGAAGTALSGSGGATENAGQGGAAPCTDQVPPDDMLCGDDLTGTWIATGCSLRVTGAVDLSGLGLVLECTAPVAGFLRVSGTVTFDGGTYEDNTITSGESTFELDPACLEQSVATCDVFDNVLQRALGYASVRCVSNQATLGCTCTGDVRQTGGLGFVSVDASTYGTYATMGNEVTLTASGIDTEYASCVSPSADTLTLSLVTVAKTGTVADPIGFVKQ